VVAKLNCAIYPSQTKILEGRTNLSECVFEALFKGVSTRFGLRIVEKGFENTLGKVGSDSFGEHTIELGGIHFMRWAKVMENGTAGR
jgi:hypothetical protein